VVLQALSGLTSFIEDAKLESYSCILDKLKNIMAMRLIDEKQALLCAVNKFREILGTHVHKDYKDLGDELDSGELLGRLLEKINAEIHESEVLHGLRNHPNVVQNHFEMILTVLATCSR
jgi:hypothetical protein